MPNFNRFKRRGLIWLAIVLAACGLFSGHWLSPLDWKFFDQSLRWRLAWAKAPPLDSRLCFLEITDQDAETFHSVSEEYAAIARLITDAADLGARLVVFDVIFQQAREVDGQPLLQAIQASHQVVLAEALLGEGGSRSPLQRKRSLPFGPRLVPAGLINATPDLDGVLRHYPFVQPGETNQEPSLALAAFLTLQGLKWPQDIKFNASGELEWEELGPDNATLVTRKLSSQSSLLNFRCGWQDTNYAAARHWSLANRVRRIRSGSQGKVLAWPRPLPWQGPYCSWVTRLPA